MVRHKISASPTTVHWGYFDATLAPVAEVDPGGVVEIGTVSGAPADLPEAANFTVRENLKAIHAAVKPELGPHILTGPIAVRGAEPGDALRVEILDVSLADDWGFNLIRPELGTLPEDFPYERREHLGIDRAAGTVSTPWGTNIPAHPFFGVMGTAPAPAVGRITSVAPGSFGGNIDNKELVPGSVLFLPVSVPGALFSVGDGHAAQGDGEVCLTAVETGLTGSFRLDLIKNAQLPGPFAETPSHLIAMAFDEDLDEAAKIALRQMIALISQRTGLAAEAAYRLCSIAADLRVTQLVNRKKGIHVMLKHAFLSQA
ncbi:MAG: acetamidase/formamidase family protein [Rhodomicrobium sp.]